jgi:hypothetical protein
VGKSSGFQEKLEVGVEYGGGCEEKKVVDHENNHRREV